MEDGVAKYKYGSGAIDRIVLALLFVLLLSVVAAYLADTPSHIIASYDGVILATYPNTGKHPAPPSVIVKADNGHVFHTVLIDGNSMSPTVTHIYNAGTPVNVVLLESSLFGKTRYRASLRPLPVMTDQSRSNSRGERSP